jgi:hypothetical protein
MGTDMYLWNSKLTKKELKELHQKIRETGPCSDCVEARIKGCTICSEEFLTEINKHTYPEKCSW